MVQKGFRRGLTVVELVVLLGIMALLLGLLLPAIQASRKSALDTLCKNNLRQIGLALEQLRGASEKLPNWHVDPERAGGWSVAILPFLDPAYGSNVHENMAIDAIGEKYRRRPLVLTCPLANDEADPTKLDRTHYVLGTSNFRKDWSIRDVSIHARKPWLAGIESDKKYPRIGPHRGGFFKYHRNGQLYFVDGEEAQKKNPANHLVSQGFERR